MQALKLAVQPVGEGAILAAGENGQMELADEGVFKPFFDATLAAGRRAEAVAEQFAGGFRSVIRAPLSA